MVKMKEGWAYLLRFAAAFLAAYTVTSLLVLPLQEMLPASQRIALDFFAPYRAPGLVSLTTQLLRALVLAAVLYPFYHLVVRGERAGLLLFAVLWGLSLVGSIQPMPGSFEGVLYTQTGLLEHGLILAAGALQTGLFILLFLPWQRRGADPESPALTWQQSRRPRGYLPRFVLLYVAIYLVAGMLFYQLAGYEQAFAEMEVFELYRPLENPAMGAAVFFGQFLRGTMLALLLSPFVGSCLAARFGGLRFFALYFGTTALGGPIFIPDLFSGVGEISAAQFLTELAAGVPEITVQMLLFSLLFIAWQKRRIRRVNRRGSAEPEALGAAGD
jgi:hypothetical protein